MDITRVKGYDEGLYSALRADLAKTGATQESHVAVDARIEMLVAAGQSFSEAVAQVKADLPVLTPPLKAGAAAQEIPSLAAKVLALITETANEQRKQHRDARIQREKEVIASIEQQAKDIRSKAVAQLVTGIVSGAVSIGMGALSLGMTAKGSTRATNEGEQARTAAQTQAGFNPNGEEALTEAQRIAGQRAFDAAYQSVMASVNTRVQAFNTIGGGAGNVLQGISQYFVTIQDNKLKMTEAKTEQIRQTAEALKDIEQSLQALIQKSQATMDAIQTNVNQTRTRILG